MLIIAHPPKAGSLYSGSTDWLGSSRAFWTLELAQIPGVDGKGSGNGANTKGPVAPCLRCYATSYGSEGVPLWLRGYPEWETAPPDAAAESWAQAQARHKDSGERGARHV